MNAQTSGIVIKRHAPEQGREFDEITVVYTIYNTASFDIDHFTLTEVFEGTREKVQVISFDHPIARAAITVKKVKYKLDAGMGNKSFGPLSIAIRDQLNIFQFMMVEDRPSPLKVYPRLQEVYEHHLHGAKEAINFGLFDLPVRGDTTNFIGTREYRDGDPVKRINWKLSLKTSRLIVNEFEKNVNTAITILIQMDTRVHMGQADSATWEYCKDLALGIAGLQLSRGNTVQIISNQKFIPLGTGERHLSYLELAMCEWPLTEDKTPETLVETSLARVPQGSNIYFITPCISSPIFEENIKAFIKAPFDLRDKYLVLVDGTKEIGRRFKDHQNLSIPIILEQTRKRVADWLQIFKDMSLNHYHVIIDSSLPYNQLMKNALKPKARKNAPAKV